MPASTPAFGVVVPHNSRSVRNATRWAKAAVLTGQSNRISRYSRFMGGRGGWLWYGDTGCGAPGKEVGYGKFGYGNFHQVEAGHLIDDTQFAGCCPVAGIESLIAGTVEVDAFAQGFKDGKKVDLVVLAGKAVGFGQVARVIFHQCYQVSFGEGLQQVCNFGRGTIEGSAQLIILILDVVQHCQGKLSSEC